MQPLILDAYKHLERLHKSRAFPSYREKEAAMLLADMQKGTSVDVRIINAALKEGMITGELQGVFTPFDPFGFQLCIICMACASLKLKASNVASPYHGTGL